MTTAAYFALDDLEAIATCSFCAGLSGALPQRATETSIIEDDRFVAWVSIGALTEGHLLVVPRRHVLSCGQLNAVEQRELVAFARRTATLLSNHYDAPCLFEHGPARAGSAVGCSVDHAHLHVIPFAGSLVDAAIASYIDLPWEIVDGGLVVGLETAAPGPYLLAQDADGQTALAVSEDIPSQALRRTIATRLGRAEEWDWKSHPHSRRILRTRVDLTSNR